MQTNLADFIRDTPEGREADAILRACVHCGFCTATCPTYQLLGDELDGPRGRIYLMKRVLEGETPTRRTQLHLDRCLTCRNCETTCPSGVQYGRLVEIGRKVVEDRVERPLRDRVLRWVLKETLPRRALFGPALKAGQALRPLLPQALRNKVPPRQQQGAWPQRQHARKMVMLEGCVQPSMAPNINAATARVFDALGISLLRPASAGCCGAIRYHMNDHQGGLDDARRNIDAWWPLLEAGAEAIIVNASGCGLQVKEYGQLLAMDPQYGERAQKISRLAKDVSEVLFEQRDRLREKLDASGAARTPVAWHPPCTLQHGQKIRGVVEEVLRAVGIEPMLCADSHLCCGSAGTYSVLQPDLSYRLRDDKLRKLDATGANAIVTANIGCATHLASGTDKPVEHWIEMVDRRLA
ncbi:MAG: glcF [Paucimonas sp.]|nr:glcF [Paucimonas sp.]